MNPQQTSYFSTPGALKPLMTPLMVSGLDDRLVREISPILESYGLSAMQAGGSTSAPVEKNKDEAARFEPGSVLAVPLMTGDVDLTAIGTVTEVLGDRVYGFGHPFNNEGPVAWPMGTGRVNAIIASIVSSFKLGSMLDMAGTLHSDAMTGIAGEIGAAPRMIPIDLEVKYADGSSARHYHFNAAIHPQITPMLVYYALRTAMSSARELPQYHTVEYDLKLEFADGQQVPIKNTAVNDGFGVIGGDVMLAVQLANDNPFKRVYLRKVTGQIRVLSQAREAEILSVNIPRLKYRPGQTVRGYVAYRPFRGAESSMPFELVLPQNLNDGQYRLVVSDRSTYLTQLFANEPFRFYVESTQQIFDAVRALEQYQRSALYLQLIKNPTGVAVGRTALPSLPSSRQQVLLKSGRSNTTVYTPSVVRVVPNALQMQGAAEFMIEIDKSAKVEVAGQLPQESQKQHPHHAPDEQPQNPAQKHDPVVPPEQKPPQTDQAVTGQQVISQQ